MTTADLISKLNLPSQTLAAVNAIPLPGNYPELKESFFHGTPLFKDYAANDPNGLFFAYIWIGLLMQKHSTILWESQKSISGTA